MIEQVKQIVREASEIIKRAGDIAENTMAKEGTANYVTKYDLEVQKFLMKRVSETFEGCNFIGEEAGCDENPVARGLTFIIDPIDGTTNFICRFQYSAISVGVVLDGEIVGGVVYNPYRGEMFWAEKGRGAYLNDTRLQPQDGPLSSSVVIFGTAPYRPELRDDAFRLARAISDHTMDLREPGTASLSICYVAAGRCSAYYSPQLSVWDYAGAAALLQETGARFVRGDGKGALNFASKVPFLAGMPSAVEEFLRVERETLG